jgi:hypothetical protein
MERGRLELLRLAAQNMPNTIRVLPDAIRLDDTFDVSRLVADLATLDSSTWEPLKVSSSQGGQLEFELDWRILPLRSIAGDASRTDAGMPGLDDYADTKWLAGLPYIRQVLASIPAPLRAVRLITLGPGTEQPLHADMKVGFPWGIVRLHVPITTAAGAVLRFEDSTHQWQPGSFWFGNFAKAHQVVHTGEGRRVHLVIDTHVTRELLDLFPADALARVDESEILLHQPEVRLTEDRLEDYTCTFQAPISFVANMLAEPFGQFMSPQPTVRAEVVVREGRLIMLIDGEARLGLVHVGADEFRFTAWTDERSIRIEPAGRPGRREVVLVAREGNQRRELKLMSTGPT